MNVVIGAKTDPGRRTNNEDQLAVVDVRRHELRADGVLVIADGMGGRNFGEQASSAAVETVQATLIEMLASARPDAVDTGEALASALRKANARVYELGHEDETHQGMGTTCVAAVISGETLSIAHAGDSRAYLLRDGALQRLTDDHSYVAEQVRAGVISEESAQRSRFRNVITRAIGIEPTITPDLGRHSVRSGDALLLCTDGLTNMVPEDQIARIMQQAPSPQTAAERLVQIANRNGGKDNITAIVARLEVSNRTQRMLAEELSRLNPRNRTQQMRVEDLPAPPPRNGVSARPAPAPAAAIRRPAPPHPAFWPIFSILMVCTLLGVIGYLVHVLTRQGYQFQVQRPFFVKPVPVLPPPPDLSRVHYAPPALFYVRPVQGGLLTLNQVDGSVTVVTEASQVVRLAPDGTLLFQSPPDAAAALPPVPADGNQHFAADPAGDLYIADTAARVIYRYPAGGGPLGEIPSRWLQHPGAIAVAADGTLYVIDAGRLLVLRPLPPGSKPPPPRAPVVPALPMPDLGDPLSGLGGPLPAPPARHGASHAGKTAAPGSHP